jgi:hypothetical protein
MEYCCNEQVSKQGDILCARCSEKICNPEPKYQSKHTFNHGNVGGPYSASSKLYGSPYYLEELKRGWKISEHDELRAKAAVTKALSMGRKKVQPANTVISEEAPFAQEAPVAQEVPVVQEAPLEKKKRAYNRKKPVASAVPEDTVTEVKAKPVKLKTHRSKKILPTEVLLPQVPVAEIPLEICPKFVEVVAPPITITDVVVVKVKKLKSQGKEYYYDANSGKVYGISVNGVGAYKGRYNEEDDTVDTTYPDSDNE